MTENGDMSEKKLRWVLPYELRYQIWNTIRRRENRIDKDELFEMFYQDAPLGIPENQFRKCLASIRSKYVLGQRPRIPSDRSSKHES